MRCHQRRVGLLDRSELPLSFGVDYVRGQHRVLLRRHQHRVRPGVVADRSVLLPARQQGVLRSRVPARCRTTSARPAIWLRSTSLPTSTGTTSRTCSASTSRCARPSRRYPSRANQYSVALELQADCFAGAWGEGCRPAGRCSTTPREIEEALNAAAAVGDDSIQQKTGGRVDPESWTHGSSAQRVEWFQRGTQTGDPQRCTTFSEVL